ncbi:hypothetical protein RS84_03514 [Microbacterium hydrocarbonoxydans]|uniref:4-amino-4-deoxy-L-arabinose transferase n=1 Tax=Microbacterium hydrocarbonoxydans TaxID=273678 RepID=A0A0M2HQW4_9MICO|nr:hypothetical protein [Microbacterium hydrocarbonoxydans]KJL46872.1 hypothetical protein RS84_03514 [Microbacterium hydrocarbonoxydans]
MTSTSSPEKADRRTETAPLRRPRFVNWVPVTTMLAATLLGTLLPVLRTRVFYYWDDTAGVAVGVWQRIAESVLSGQSPFLQLDMWRGGNFIAEAATGMWNPVMLGLMLGTYPIDDVAVAITAAKIVLFLITAGGVYLLARGYGANAWMSAVAGVVLPLSGWSIFMDGAAWINGTAIMAFTPWAWWALRRAYLRGFRARDIALAVVLGYLVPSTGNPYGVLTLAVVFLAVAVEALVSRRAGALRWLIPMGLSIVLLIVVVYLPFVLTSQYGVRASSGIGNDEFLAVNLNDLLGMSTPTLRPYIKMFGGLPMQFPGTYLAWFVVPLLPWLRWGALGDGWKQFSSALTFGVFFLAFVLGPSQLGMFRWPARLVPFLYLAVLMVFAVLASKGIERSRPVLRSIVSGALILFGTWIAYSDVPGAWKWHGLVTLLMGFGTFAIVRWTGLRRSGALVMIAGMLVFLAPQLMLTASNQNVADYRMPSSKSEMRKTFADRTDGLVVQIFDINVLVGDHPESDRWDDLLAGNMPSVAGFSSTTGYTGIGFNAFDNALCMSYNGGTCADAWDALWEKPKGADAVLADLIGAKYVVVAKGYTDDRRAPEGWTRTESTDVVNVYERDEPVPYAGTVSSIGGDVEITADERHGATAETLTVSTTGDDSSVTFARIAWPGYQVAVDGKPVPVEIGPAGLLTVTLPEDLADAEVTVSFTPPGLWIGLATAAAGLVGAAALMVIAVKSPRMSRKAERRPQGALG